MAVDLSGECRRKQWMDTAPCGRPPRVRVHHPLLGKTDVWGMWMDLFVQTYYDELFICIHYVSVTVLYYMDIHTYNIYICTAAASKDSLCRKKNWGYLLNARADANIADRIWAGDLRKIGSCEGWFLVISGDLWWFMSLTTGNLWFWTWVVGSWGNPSSTSLNPIFNGLV